MINKLKAYKEQLEKQYSHHIREAKGVAAKIELVNEMINEELAKESVLSAVAEFEADQPKEVEVEVEMPIAEVELPMPAIEENVAEESATEEVQQSGDTIVLHYGSSGAQNN